MGSVPYTGNESPLSFLERSARAWPDKTAVVYGARRLTYAERRPRRSGLARALRAGGVGPWRSRVCLPDAEPARDAHRAFAVPLAGAALVVVNTRLTAEEAGYILDHSGAKIMVVDAALLPTAAAAAKDVAAVTELAVAEDTESAPAYPHPGRRAAAGELLRAPGPGHSGAAVLVGLRRARPHSAINYTSGTTGRAKRAPSTPTGARTGTVSARSFTPGTTRTASTVNTADATATARALPGH